MKRITAEQAAARAEMYREAASHLEMSVAETPAEKEAAKLISAELYRKACFWTQKANDLKAKGSTE